MALVVDSSVAVSWMLADEDSQVASKALAEVAADGMIVPGIFWYEFRNTLIVNERRGRLRAEESGQALAVLAALAPAVFGDHSEIELMRLARTHDLSVYDAAYVEVALRNEAGLATLDVKMAKAAIREGVSVLD